VSHMHTFEEIMFIVNSLCAKIIPRLKIFCSILYMYVINKLRHLALLFLFDSTGV
jgi:hypothetical protein